MKKQVLLILKPSPARESLTQLLTEQGFDVESQPSTFRAVSTLAKRPCEAVVLGLDDLLEEEIEVVRVIREECPGVFLLVTFTAINRRKALSSLEMGADAYALEPLRPEEAAAMLRRIAGVLRPAVEEPAAPLKAEPAFEPVAPEAGGPVPKPVVQRPAHVEKTRANVEKSPPHVEKLAPDVETGGPSAHLLQPFEPTVAEVPAPQPSATTVLSEVSADRLASLRKLGASVAHEINNPLTTLSGWIQLLLKKANGNQDLRRTLVNMKEEADRIADVVRQLSAISEPDLAGRGPVDINTLADAIVDAFVGMNGNAKIRVKRIFTADPPAVKVDRDLLVRAVCDLLTSSYLSLGNSGSLVFTTTATSDAVEFRVYEPGSQVCLDGLKRGMSSVDLGESEKIGQDLMLARCQEIISSHGGSFTADCDVREGLNFAVRLPRAGERS